MTGFLDRARLCRAVDGTLWDSLSVVDETASTNADAAAAARSGAPQGYVRVSCHQSAGKGRFDRTWTAPPGTSVAVSALVRPGRRDADWGWLSLLVGVAVIDAVRDAAGLDATLKWPNDVLVDERKVCGILSERVETVDGPAAVLGVGLNISQSADQLPVPTATSLHLAGSSIDATSVTIALLASLERWYREWNDGADLADAYRSRCGTLGLAGAVPAPETVTGRAVDVDAEGRLVVEVSGRRRAFAAGDVVHLRRPEF